MNPICISILTRLAIEPNGRITKQALYGAFPQAMRQIASLGTGTRPNMFLDSATNEYQLTKRGYDNMTLSGCNLNASRVTRDALPDFVRDAVNGSAHRARNARRNATTQASASDNVKSLIELDIDRNEYVTIRCKVSDELKNWIVAHGTRHTLNDDFGRDAVRNWDAEDDTEYIYVGLQNLDASQNGSNIVTSYGINSLLIKLACASETNEYVVKYRGLVAWELLQGYSNKVGDNVVSFYKNFIQPCKLKIVVNWSV